MPEIELETPQLSPIIAKKSEVDARAEELRAKRTLPKKPGNKVTFEELLGWLRLLSTPEMRERIMLYVYRVFPRINRKFSDPDNYNNIDVFSGDFSSFNEAYFINAFGGGVYKILIKDTDSKKEDERSE